MKPRIWAEIDLAAIRHNLGEIRSLAGIRTEIMPVVKSNAYGHGVVEIAKTVVDAGTDWLCVANVADGAALRKLFPTVSICLLAPFVPDQAEEVVKHQITPIISSIAEGRALSQASHALRSGIKAHIDIDTGM